MRIIISVLLSFFMAAVSCFAQNRLSPIWKYHKMEKVDGLLQKDTATNQHEVNLLMSWERQGLCWIDGMLVLDNKFFVNAGEKDLMLDFSFGGDVRAIYINDIRVVGGKGDVPIIATPEMTRIHIPHNILHKGGDNRISVLISNLSYTGGLSHNFCSVSSAGYDVKNTVKIIIPVDDHVFLPGKRQYLSVESDNATDCKVRFVVKSDFHKTFVDTTILMRKGFGKFQLDMDHENLPSGIYECVAISSGVDKTFCGNVAWFAVRPAEIRSEYAAPEDFNLYWQKALTELKGVEPCFRLKKVDSLCSPWRNGYIVSMQSLGGITIRGYYFVPKTPGKHPAVIQLPGYGYGFENIKRSVDSRTDAAELDLCVRGHGISKDVFNPWDKMTLWAVGICDRKKYVYRSVYMDCARAVDFLLAQPDIDNKRIGVVGGSQGGGLALATAGLRNKNIAACVIFDPFLCDIREQAEIRTMINKELNSFRAYT
ncbi:MAG: acetylxylan esterase, partial [Bacteroidales bacterium]|nr:acetylxylan esterase [Bacteroidales bacterium]